MSFALFPRFFARVTKKMGTTEKLCSPCINLQTILVYRHCHVGEKIIRSLHIIKLYIHLCSLSLKLAIFNTGVPGYINDIVNFEPLC